MLQSSTAVHLKGYYLEYKVERIVANMRAHLIIGTRIIASNRYSIYESKDFGVSWDECGSLPVPIYNKLASIFQPSSRLFRSGISQIKKLSNSSILIGADRSFFFLTLISIILKKSTFHLDHSNC